jgi:DNA polymerase-3 subunit alpha
VYREIHVRLKSGAADVEETLYPLRDFLFENSGSCGVFFHVPVGASEAVVKAANQITASPDDWVLEAIGMCAGVAEAWKE